MLHLHPILPLLFPDSELMVNYTVINVPFLHYFCLLLSVVHPSTSYIQPAGHNCTYIVHRKFVNRTSYVRTSYIIHEPTFDMFLC